MSKENAKVRLAAKVALSKIRKRHWVGARSWPKTARQPNAADKAVNPNALTRLVKIIRRIQCAI